jgi:hypothetical protein
VPEGIHIPVELFKFAGAGRQDRQLTADGFFGHPGDIEE